MVSGNTMTAVSWGHSSATSHPSLMIQRTKEHLSVRAASSWSRSGASWLRAACIRVATTQLPLPPSPRTAVDPITVPPPPPAPARCFTNGALHHSNSLMHLLHYMMVQYGAFIASCHTNPFGHYTNKNDAPVQLGSAVVLMLWVKQWNLSSQKKNITKRKIL